GNKPLVQIVDALNRLASEADDDVAIAHAGRLRRAALLDADNQNAALAGQTMEARHACEDGRVLPGHANPAPANAAFFDEPGGHELRRVAGDGETDALRRQNDGCVYSNHFAM